VVGTGRREQQRFRLRSPTLLGPGQEQFANSFGALASAWFAGDDDLQTALGQSFGEGPDLSGLADPFPAFEGDELSAFAHAIPNSDLRPSQMRPKKPALPTSSPATSGTTCGGVSPVVITS